MKTRLMISTITALLIGVGLAMAQPPGKGPTFRKYKSLKSVDDFKSVKKGDKLAFVCLECHTVAELQVEAEEDAMAYCKDGAQVTCPGCKKSYKTVRHGPPGKGLLHRHVKYVNEAGEECAFVTSTSVVEENEQADD